MSEDDIDMSVSEESRQILQQAKIKFGFIPNLMLSMAAAPALLKSYVTLADFFEETSFSNEERQVVLLGVSYENECGYCMAAHSTMANMSKVPQEIVSALRGGRTLPDEKLNTLLSFVCAVVKTRGWPGDEQTRAFIKAGYTQRHILEVVLGVGMKTLSNYTNHIAATPLDEPFQPQAWSK